MKTWPWFLGMIIVPTLAAADVLSNDERPLDLALSLSKTKTSFDYTDGTSINTTIEAVEVNWYERFTSGIQIGLHVGKSYLTQTNYPTTAGLEPDGYNAGIGIRATFLETSWIRPFAHVTYMYRRVTHDDANQSVTISWYEPAVKLGASTVWQRINLHGGATWSAIDGQERITGAAPSTDDFERSGTVGGFLGLDLLVEQDGHVGAEAFSGAKRGIEIYFKKGF